MGLSIHGYRKLNIYRSSYEQIRSQPRISLVSLLDSVRLESILFSLLNMSGFLPDIANWALRGGAGRVPQRRDNSDDEDDDHDEEEEDENEEDDEEGNMATDDSNALPTIPITPEELRAQRLARLQSSLSSNSAATPTDPAPMDIYFPAKPKATSKKAMDVSTATSSANTKKLVSSNERVQKVAATVPDKTQSVKKAKSNEEITPAELSKKLQRKKELLLSKCLLVQLVGGTTMTNSESSGLTLLDTGSTEISVATIAEILASRLSMEPATTAASSPPSSSSSSLQNSQSATPLLVIAYLGAAYNRTTEELRTLHSSKKSLGDGSHAALVELLQEIQKQSVSYAATCLVEPSVFAAMAKHVHVQLGHALLVAASTGAAETNITMGGVNSFYYQVMEELVQQNSLDCIQRTVKAMVTLYTTLLGQADSVAGSISVANSDLGTISPTMVVSALTSICLHKSAASAIAELDAFLLPAAGTSEAVAMVRPPIPTGLNPLQQLLSNVDAHRPYAARSGPGLEKSTLLGLMLRVGAPKSGNNPPFAPHAVMRQPQATSEAIMRSQRQQLTLHQEACFQFTKAFLKSGGPSARIKLLAWFTDALLVNTGASALRPDPSKVSSTSLLLNISMMLLKLCHPFVIDESKHHLIDGGFVSSSEAHGGVFCTVGDDAVPRLGGTESGTATATTAYNPRNAFIPHCFFFCARSLHFGIVPLLRVYEHLMRHISHVVHEVTSAGRDIHAEPQFAGMISRQRGEEVALFQEEMLEATLTFCNFTAKVLNDMDDATIATMPEEFVSDICDILMLIAYFKPEALAGHEFRYVFKLVVKLLSPMYANVSWKTFAKSLLLKVWNSRCTIPLILTDGTQLQFARTARGRFA
jgi:Ubiquitin elongating factor core